MRVIRDGTTAGQTRRFVMCAAIAGLLLLPLLAMQFTDEVAWTPADFVSAAALLGGAALIYEVAARRILVPGRRKIVGAAIITLLAVIWAQGAVGIF